METEAWLLLPGGSQDEVLTRRTIELPALRPGEVLVEPIYGCWEGNMTHAAQRQPIDVCRERGEEYVVIGNAGVVRVLECGADVEGLREGDTCLVFCNGVPDGKGYPDRIYAYDAPGTIGLLARRTRLHWSQLIPVSTAGGVSLAQWAAFSLRYITAWANWRAAYGCWRVLADEDAVPHVWGWGGGVTYAELTLAVRAGCPSTMIASGVERLRLIQESGVQSQSRDEFAGLDYDPQAYATDREYRDRYGAAERRFLEIVGERTNGDGVGIFVDFIGLPVYRATLKALGRPGVITTAGWKEGMHLSMLRAIECMRWHTHVHTHYARRSEAMAAVEFAVEHGWVPPPPERIYTWDEVPQLAEAHAREEERSYFPLFAVNPE